jgi:hypothetical protein
MDPSVPENSEAFYLELGAIGFFRKRVDGNALVDLIKSVCSETKSSVQSDTLCLSPTCTCTSVNCSQLRSTFQSTIVKWIDVLLQSNGLDLADTHVLLTKNFSTSEREKPNSRSTT